MDSESAAKKYLDVVEYIAFGGLLLVSTLIGAYFAYRDRKDATVKNYYFGGKDMNPLAVGLSMAVSYQSAIVVIAAPAETYISGTLMIWEPIAKLCAVPIAFFYFIPTYHRLQLTTVYEFLGLRYNVVVRRIASAIRAVAMIFYVGAVIYMPAAALSAVTPLPMASSVLLTGVICTFYTTLGGMKAVIWTDVLQSGIMIIGLLAVFIKGLHVVGGFWQLLETVKRGGRDTVFRFDFGIISRLSPVSILAGSFIFGTMGLGIQQPVVQRYQSCKTAKLAQWSLLCYLLPNLIISLASFGNGLIMYAYFEGCDPVLSGQLKRIDQGIPYMALEIFESIPGMAGIFVAAIFSASLSTISSCINSLSMLMLEDFIVAKWPIMRENVKIIVGKSIVAILGVIVTATAFGISASKANVFVLLYGFTGLINGPIFGLYIMGFFMPWVTTVGAMIGVCGSYLIVAFMYIGKKFFNRHPYLENVPAVSTTMCELNASATANPYTSDYTTTILPVTNFTTRTFGNDHSFLQDVYNINFSFVLFLSFGLTLIIGLVASLITGHTPASKADPKLFIPLIDNKFFSLRMRKFFRFGVPEQKSSEAFYSTSQLKKSQNSESLPM